MTTPLPTSAASSSNSASNPAQHPPQNPAQSTSTSSGRDHGGSPVLSDLTDRYVREALRGIPARQRERVDQELRASIADAVDARLEAGWAAGELTASAAAEREVLTELGDPDRLAAAYTNHSFQLIGPALYFDWRKLMTVVLSSIVPLIFLLIAGIGFLTGRGPMTALGGAFVATVTITVHVLFWTTLGFAVVERILPRADTGGGQLRRRWTLEALQDTSTERVDFGLLIGGVTLTAFLASLLVLSQEFSPVIDTAGRPVPLIAPALWESGALYLLVAIAISRIWFDLLAYYVGWGIPQACANAVLAVLFVVPVVVLLVSGQLLNPRFFSAIGWSYGASPVGGLTWVIVSAVAVLGLIDVVQGFVRGIRGARDVTERTNR